MVMIRSLTDNQEVNVTISKLCGVSYSEIKKIWDVSNSTILSVLSNRSHLWDNPLVELYRNQDNKDKNAAHFYLSIHNRNIPNKELIDEEIYKEAIKLVENSIFNSRIEDIINNIALREYTIPRNGYERLMTSIFGRYGDEYEITQSVVLDCLLGSFDTDMFSLNKIFYNSKINLIEKVKKGGLSITSIKRELIDDILETITEREQNVIKSYFGLDDDPKNLDQIGKEFGLTRERIRQIKERSIRRLQHSSRSDKIKILLDYPTDEDIYYYLETQKYNEEKEKWKEILYSEIKQDLYSEIKQDLYSEIKQEVLRTSLRDEILDTPIDRFELSIRSSNCLRAAEIRTVGQLAGKTEGELLKFRNFGRKTILELRNVLGNLGLRFSED